MKKAWKNILIGLAIGFIILIVGFLFWIKKVTITQIVETITLKEITITFKEGTSEEDIERVVKDINGKNLGCYYFDCHIKVPRLKPIFYLKKKLSIYPYIESIKKGRPWWTFPIQLD
jgi:hypothetical protein